MADENLEITVQLESGEDLQPQDYENDALKSDGQPIRRKGRGFQGDTKSDMKNMGYDAMDIDENSNRGHVQRSVEGWILIVTGVHEEATEEDIINKFGDFGELKNLHLNLDRRSGFVKGYALIEYDTYEEALAAKNGTNNTELLELSIQTSFAFVKGPNVRNRR